VVEKVPGVTLPAIALARAGRAGGVRLLFRISGQPEHSSSSVGTNPKGGRLLESTELRGHGSPVREIQRAEVRLLLEAVVDRSGEIEANRTLALFRKVFNWGISMDLAERNPCALLPRPTRPSSDSAVRPKDGLTNAVGYPPSLRDGVPPS
jgi:hypothetical protein